MNLLLILVVLSSALQTGLCQGLWCYRCVSTHPGCGSPFDWRWYWSYTCPQADDKCVKVIERKGADVVITRDCLSSLQGIRRDIPADTYEGCRSGAEDVRLAQYTFNDIVELDIKRNYYDNTTFCFCDFDQFCNGALSWAKPNLILILPILTSFWRYFSSF
uniref:EOG090X0I2F n=1 Tax=Lynceus sp. MCZ IZ 141354 TaxID=1930659 RepID=A0A9N6WWC3_9CRUS|nr:EOG090X0I2F [Lynceus sp. MCZ IZ 141354]